MYKHPFPRNNFYNKVLGVKDIGFRGRVLINTIFQGECNGKLGFRVDEGLKTLWNCEERVLSIILASSFQD